MLENLINFTIKYDSILSESLLALLSIWISGFFLMVFSDIVFIRKRVGAQVYSEFWFTLYTAMVGIPYLITSALNSGWIIYLSYVGIVTLIWGYLTLNTMYYENKAFMWLFISDEFKRLINYNLKKTQAGGNNDGK